ncbi:Lateral organ boundaries LOB [Arabidopsis thaliana x Arabidopsis arenosa]|uniref:Lateral organ boundaries LOB n=1 Tax=Arabidopsis thaliana x Arabidopsis arenosa TaxID=1240361 RepID=A0A8T2FK97_9BRAS|nr:Lateral organ boundaries LOB [Arabidopsis thaliana x Arabidopsis arenosa]
MDVSRVNVKRAPCALCTTKNKRCPKKCDFAPYFPAERQSEYENAHKLFGTSNIIKMMRFASKDKQKDLLGSSILMEGDAWKKDPARGGFGMIQKLKWQIELRKIYLNELKEKIKVEKEQTELRL